MLWGSFRTRRQAMVRVVFVALVAALSAGDAPAASPEFARHFSSKCTTVLYLHDVLPHIERVLSSEKLKAALKDSLPSAGPGALNLDNAAAMVSAQQQFIPRSVAIGITADAADDLIGLCRVAMLSGVCAGAVNAGDRESLTAAQQELLSALKQARLARITAYVEFLNPAVAPQLMAMLLGAADQFQAYPVNVSTGE